MSDYKYTVITRENSTECGFSERFWENHPDWNFFVRTDHRYPDKPSVWISGGGATLEEAIQSAEFGLQQLIFTPSIKLLGEVMLVGPRKLIGKESKTIIKND